VSKNDEKPLGRVVGATRAAEVRHNDDLWTMSKPFVVVNPDTNSRISTHGRRDEAAKAAEKYVGKK